MDQIDTSGFPSDAAAETATDSDPRRTNRESLFLGVEITRANSKPSGRIRNISPTGALVESDAVLGMGEHLVLSFRGVASIGATVVRKTARGVGVRFDTEIDPAACRMSVKASPDQRPTWAPPPMTPRFRQPGRR
jgi:hypothetical protein